MSDDALAKADIRQTLTATTFVEIVDTLSVTSTSSTFSPY